MTATIKQIAEVLGVNPSTVSRALSGHAQIAEETRDKVFRVADLLNYTPNIWAQSLAGSNTSLIGCLVLELTNPFYIPMVRAVEDVANREGYIIFLGESRRDLEQEVCMIERFRRIRAAGVIITPLMSDLNQLKSLVREGVALVVVGRNAADFDSINIDNRKSGAIAASYFIEKGYQKIAYVQSGEPYNMPEKERLDGYRETITESGEELNAIYSVGNNRITGGEKAGEMWMLDKNHPDAVFCSNDLLAMGFIQHLIKMGVKIPDDVAVLGHDDIPFVDRFIVPLSTLVFPKYEMGRIAMKRLLEKLEKGHISEKPRRIVLDPELVIRQSG